MLWLSLFGIVLAAAFLWFVLTRTTKGERQRSAQWNNLHERGLLISSQLSHLRDLEGRRSAPGVARVPQPRAAKRIGVLWRRPATPAGHRPIRAPQSELTKPPLPPSVGEPVEKEFP
jgi:hypothetical protein